WPTHESARAYMAEHWEEPWGDRRQELVFIGAAIDWPELKEKLDACLLPEHLAPNPEMLPDMPDPFPTWRRAEQAA
ncbi:MAG: GTP-binding protein, partial [Pseudomonadota bacterium]